MCQVALGTVREAPDHMHGCYAAFGHCSPHMARREARADIYDLPRPDKSCTSSMNPKNMLPSPSDHQHGVALTAVPAPESCAEAA